MRKEIAALITIEMHLRKKSATNVVDQILILIRDKVEDIPLAANSNSERIIQEAMRQAVLEILK